MVFSNELFCFILLFVNKTIEVLFTRWSKQKSQEQRWTAVTSSFFFFLHCSLHGRYHELAPHLVPMDYTNDPDVKVPLALIVNMPELKVMLTIHYRTPVSVYNSISGDRNISVLLFKQHDACAMTLSSHLAYIRYNRH